MVERDPRRVPESFFPFFFPFSPPRQFIAAFNRRIAAALPCWQPSLVPLLLVKVCLLWHCKVSFTSLSLSTYALIHSTSATVSPIRHDYTVAGAARGSNDPWFLGMGSYHPFISTSRITIAPTWTIDKAKIMSLFVYRWDSWSPLSATSIPTWYIQFLPFTFSFSFEPTVCK